MSDANGDSDHGTTRGRDVDIPAMHGTPMQFAELLASVAEVAEAEPDSTFETGAVRGMVQHLVSTLLNRTAGAAGDKVG